jgi:WD40 repeat protein/serine/threonine protein kinase/Flp pilus assembly protein TadD
MSAAESQSEIVIALAEEFLDRYRHGERPPLKEYTDRHPDLANEIRDVFPAMALMENIALADESIGEGAGGRGPCRTGSPGSSPSQLGDFRIIREVGQGGMGVVYEAEQVSLGRHVALKLLPRQVIRDAKLRQRFEREAKSAAKLHHTNIVPVYGVGEHEGTPYYVMQFIQGLGLDEVIAELARMSPGGAPPTSSQPIRRSGAARAAARSMMTGEFGAAAHDEESAKPDPAAATLTAVGALIDPPAAEVPMTGSGHGTAARRVDTAVLSSVTLPGQSESGTGRKSKKLTYWQSVARVGVQVADALEHAHRQGVIHRDVKPSNLLLDLAGTVWVTDFGLAKADDQQNLTHTGDILGTLRYMPPEAFEGLADARGDIYSLGLTLYELVTLKPAFDEKERLRLVKQVTEEEPPPLRKLRPDVPRDLETIIYKAIEKSPAHRYQTTADFAADLQRFLDDEPIQARRTTARERVWRWCRRHPVEAALMTAVQLTLVGLVVLAVWSNAKISRALADKGEALAETEKAHDEAVKARDAAVAETYRALLSETRALRLAHASGWRHQALQKLRSLALLETPQRDLAELRGEAIACIGEFDAVETMRLSGHTASVWSLDFSPDGAQLATAGYDGRINVWDVNEGRQAQGLADRDVDLDRRHNFGSMLPAVRFHPDGNRLAFATWRRGVAMLTPGRSEQPAVHVGPSVAGRYLAFDRRGKTLAISRADGRVGIYDGGSGALTREIDTRFGRNAYFPVALAPVGDLLAATGPENTVQLHSLDSEMEPVSLGHHRGIVRSLCFSPSGNVLASASEDHNVKVWDVRGRGEPMTLLGHTARVNCVAFNPDGKMLASASDDQTVRLWDTTTGQLLMVLNPAIGAVLSVAFGPDGTQLAAGGAGPTNADCQVCAYQLTSREEQRRLSGHTYMVNGLAFHPVKPVLVSGGSDKRIMEFDLATGRPRQIAVSERENPIRYVAFAPDGALLAVALGSFNTVSGRDRAIDLWDPEAGTVRRRLKGPQANVEALAFDPSGKLLAATTWDGTVFVWSTSSGDVVQRWQNPRPVVGAAFLDGGARLVVADIVGNVTIRKVDGGELVGQTTVAGGLARIAVAPGEGSLVAASQDGRVRALGLPGLEPKVDFEKVHGGPIAAIAFSPDGGLLATGGADRQVVLWDGRSYRRICSLPQMTNVHDLAFDSDGLRLAVSTAEELITLWNLAVVRPELAAVGLDWDAPLPDSKSEPGGLTTSQPPPPVRVVRAPIKPVTRTSAPVSLSGPEMLYSLGRYEDAITASEAAVKATPEAKAPYLTLASAYYQVGRYEKAAEAARRHLELCPDCGTALGRLAASRFAAGAPDEAIEILEQALQNVPNQPILSNNLAWYYVTGPEPLRDAAKALPLAQRAVALAPKNLNNQQTLGVVYYRLGKFEKAADTLRAVSTPNAPKVAEAINQYFLAMTYHRLGDAAKAKECFEKAPQPSQQAHLPPHSVKQLESIRAEAAALLALK